MTIQKRILYWLILVIFVVVFTTAAGEIVVRLFSENSPQFGYFPNFPYEYDSYVGLRHSPGKFTYRSPEFETHIEINSEGFRSSSEFITGDAEAKVIAVLGDSIVQAIQVDEDFTFPKLLEEKLKHTDIKQVQNYGISSIGIAHYLQMYRYYVRKHHPEIIVVVILDINDIRNSSPDLEVISHLRPNYYYDETGKIVDIAPFLKSDDKEQPFQKTPSLALKSYLEEHSALYQFASNIKYRAQLQESAIDQFPIDAYVYEEPWSDDFNRAWRHSIWALEKIVDEIRNDSANLLIVLVPGKWTTCDAIWHTLEDKYSGHGYLNRDKIQSKLCNFSSAINIKFLDLTDTFKEVYEAGGQPHWEVDGHLTREGHRLVADAIYHKLKNENLYAISEE